MAKALRLRLRSKLFVFLQSVPVPFRVVIERDAVETEIHAQFTLGGPAIEMAALNVIEGRRAEGQRRLIGVLRTAHEVNVGGVIDADGGRHSGMLKYPPVL